MAHTTIGNQRVEGLWTESMSSGRLYVHDQGCPWVTTAAEWSDAIEALAGDTYETQADAYQDLCDRIRPIATGNDAVDMRDGKVLATLEYTFHD